MWKRFFLGMLRAILLLFAYLKYYLKLFLSLFGKAPITILAYRGYGRRDHILLQGRVLKNKVITTSPADSLWRNLVNNYKRFGSAEIRGAQLCVSIGENKFDLTTDREGYFFLDTPLEKPLEPDDKKWRKASIRLVRTRRREIDISETAKVLVPTNAEFGVISDIDDTILITEVTSLLKLKMLYLTFLKNATNREAFHEVEAFFRALQKGKDDQNRNPVFYVSKSPWNLYDFLEDFIELNELPRGPLLLRDIGLLPRRFPFFESLDKQYRGHKISSVARILRMYPELPFILVGDSGEKDAEIYLTIAKSFPGQVKAIYIHDVKEPRRSRHTLQLIQQSGVENIKLVSSYREAAEDAERRGFLNMKVFEEFGSGKR
ncbi:MAG: phosphatase domain-containing protein [Saprospiraceae bacterium]|nr:phosphatase domain-containing protein [Saprospiraceae bacterium]